MQEAKNRRRRKLLVGRSLLHDGLSGSRWPGSWTFELGVTGLPSSCMGVLAAGWLGRVIR
jgi:hypothetical protein